MTRLTPIEQAERTLAKLVQNAKARGLGWCADNYYEYEWGSPHPESVVRCGALGAASLSPPVEVTNKGDLADGNDQPHNAFYFYTIDFDIGAAFRDVMTHDDKETR